MSPRAESFRQWTWLPGPLAVAFSTILVVTSATGRPVSLPGVTLFIAGVVTAYTWDRWADCPDGTRPRWCLVVAGLATIAGLVAATRLPMEKTALAMILGLMGLGYRRLKTFPLLKTGLVALAWSAAEVGFSVQPPPPPAVGLRLGAVLFTVYAAGALLCDFKDILDDARGGVRTAPVLWGASAAARISAGLAVAGVALALALNRPGLACSGLVLAGLSFFPRVVARPVLGPVLVDGALALPAVFILSGLA